jgi:hypothetical protein
MLDIARDAPGIRPSVHHQLRRHDDLAVVTVDRRAKPRGLDEPPEPAHYGPSGIEIGPNETVDSVVTAARSTLAASSSSTVAPGAPSGVGVPSRSSTNPHSARIVGWPRALALAQDRGVVAAVEADPRATVQVEVLGEP